MTLPSLPQRHNGYALHKSADLPLEVISASANAPVFTDGTNTTRAIPENTASGTNIGTAVAATDADNDTLTYTLGGTDAASFTIVSTSGQLQTSAALDYETKASYSVTVSVSDGNGGSNTIDVTINITDANDAPVFTDGTSTTRAIAENTVTGTNIGTAVAATDADTGDTLTYTLGGTDAASFTIVGASGQLRTKAALDYETKASYTVTVTVYDGNNGGDRTTVTINVTDVNDNPINPPLSERTQQVRDAIVAAVPGVNTAADVTPEHLAAITYLSLDRKSITTLKSGDFDGLTSLTVLVLSNNPISSLPTDIFDELSALRLLNISRNQFGPLPDGIFDDLTNLTELYLPENQLSSLPDGIFDDLTNLTWLDLAENQLSTLPSDIFDDLTKLTRLELDQNQLVSLPADIFSELSELTFLNLYTNQLDSLPDGIFEGLTNLTNLYLSENTVDPLPLTVSLKKVADGQFKAVAPAGGPV